MLMYFLAGFSKISPCVWPNLGFYFTDNSNMEFSLKSPCLWALDWPCNLVPLPIRALREMSKTEFHLIGVTHLHLPWKIWTVGADGGFSFSGPISVTSCIGNWFNDFDNFTIGDAVTFTITQRDMYQNPVFSSGSIPSFTFHTVIVLASDGVTPVTMNSMTISLSCYYEFDDDITFVLDASTTNT